MNFILIFVTGFVSILLVLISNKLDLLTVLLLFVLLLANGLLLSFVGVFVNLLFPKLDYENETQVVKQSLSVTVSMFSFMILFMIFPAIYFFLSMEEVVLDMNLLIGLNIIVSLILFSLTLILINKKAEGLIKKL
jgi:ABC-2 type transport system permease protein